MFIVSPTHINLHVRGWQIPMMLLARTSSQRRRLDQGSQKDWSHFLVIASSGRVLQPKPKQASREDLVGANFLHDSLQFSKSGLVLNCGEGLAATNRQLMDFAPSMKPQSIFT